MSPRTAIWVGMIIGSSVGGMIPGLWGAGMLSMSGLLWSAVGGFAGIWMGYKITR